MPLDPPEVEIVRDDRAALFLGLGDDPIVGEARQLFLEQVDDVVPAGPEVPPGRRCDPHVPEQTDHAVSAAGMKTSSDAHAAQRSA
jgi:hypothetical protein